MFKKVSVARVISLAAILIFLSACSKQIVLPPINPVNSNEHHFGKFIWHDLLTDDPSAVKSFYGNLLGWNFTPADPEDERYYIIYHEGSPIGGMVAIQDLKKEVEYSQWLPYLSVESVDSAAEYFERNGGKVEREPYDMLNRGRFAALSDPQGAVLAVLRSNNGDKPDGKPEINEWLWNELWADDKDAALSFYKSFLGYEVKEIDALDESLYYTLHKENTPRAGIFEIPVKNVNPNWLSYIAVSDVSEVKNKAEELGGRVLIFVEGTKRGAAAIIADPSGAVFGIQKWPINEGEKE